MTSGTIALVGVIVLAAAVVSWAVCCAAHSHAQPLPMGKADQPEEPPAVMTREQYLLLRADSLIDQLDGIVEELIEMGGDLSAERQVQIYDRVFGGPGVNDRWETE